PRRLRWWLRAWLYTRQVSFVAAPPIAPGRGRGWARPPRRSIPRRRSPRAGFWLSAGSRAFRAARQPVRIRPPASRSGFAVQPGVERGESREPPPGSRRPGTRRGIAVARLPTGSYVEGIAARRQASEFTSKS